MMHIKKDDQVCIISGKDKGKQGTVMQVSPKKSKVKIKGLAVVTRHVKPRRQGEVGGIRKEESFIHFSNVMPVCPSCKKPCRVGVIQLQDGKRVRSCRRCKEVIER